MTLELSDHDLDLIDRALDNLADDSESELDWCNGDPYIVEANRKRIDEIASLREKLTMQPDNRSRVGIPSAQGGSNVCPYCHAVGVRAYCPDCGAKMFYGK